MLAGCKMNVKVGVGRGLLVVRLGNVDVARLARTRLACGAAVRNSNKAPLLTFASNIDGSMFEIR